MDPSDASLVNSIFAACAELSRRTGRKVSPDGHLVGSLGEVFASQELGLTLASASDAGFDAIAADGTLVEIKTTTRASIAFSPNATKAERVVVVRLDPITGDPRIVFDGAMTVALTLAGKPQKNGQRQVTVSRLCANHSG